MPDKNHDMGPVDPQPNQLFQHSAPAGLKRWGSMAVVAAVAVAMLGIGWRMYKNHTTAAWTDAQAVPTVQIIKLKSPKTGSTLTLPGDVQAFTSAPIYAQVSGYVKKWYFDIGAPVKKGQLLAELDTPDLAGQSAQGRANLVNAIAAQNLSEATARRYDALEFAAADNVKAAPKPASVRRMARLALALTA